MIELAGDRRRLGTWWLYAVGAAVLYLPMRYVILHPEIEGELPGILLKCLSLAVIPILFFAQVRALIPRGTRDSVLPGQLRGRVRRKITVSREVFMVEDFNSRGERTHVASLHPADVARTDLRFDGTFQDPDATAWSLWIPTPKGDHAVAAQLTREAAQSLSRELKRAASP